MENEGEEKNGEKGKENAGTKEEEEGKEAGREGMAPGRWGAPRRKTRAKKTQKKHKGNGKPKDGDRKGRKDNKEKEVPGRKTHKENIGHVSGGVHKGKINKEGAKAVKRRRYRDKKDGYNWTEDTHKESMEDALEQRDELERRNGWGGKDCKKEKTPEQRAHTGKARKMHKKPHMKTPHIY